MNINIILKIIHVLLAIWNKHTLDSMRKKGIQLPWESVLIKRNQL